jgi:hypothetical protein
MPFTAEREAGLCASDLQPAKIAQKARRRAHYRLAGHCGPIERFVIAVAITLTFIDCLAEPAVLKDLLRTAMDCAKSVLMLIFASVILAGADVVGTLNVHTTLSGKAKTGVDTGQPIPVQVDFSKTPDGRSEVPACLFQTASRSFTTLDPIDGARP